MSNGYKMIAKAGKSADIYLYGDVGDSWFGGVSAQQFAADLKALGNVDTIDLRINSNGGDVFDGLAIHRQLMDHKAKVIAHIDGIAASIASVIAMAGDEVHMSESGFFMIHNASGMTYGTAEDARQLADLLDSVSGQIADVYVARTSQTKEQVQKWMNAETWFNSTDALAKGFVTQIAENMRVAACLNPTKYKFKNHPSSIPTVQSAPSPLSRAQFNQQRDKVATMRGAILKNKKI